jgi:predicted DNA-binding transcriptional regulator AlpA
MVKKKITTNKERRDLARRHLNYPHPLRFYRPGRLAELLDVDDATIWRWRKSGILPPPSEISPGIRGWTEEQIRELIEQRRGAADA